MTGLALIRGTDPGMAPELWLTLAILIANHFHCPPYQTPANDRGRPEPKEWR